MGVDGGDGGEHSGPDWCFDLGLNDCSSEVCLREHLELTLDDCEWEKVGSVMCL